MAEGYARATQSMLPIALGGAAAYALYKLMGALAAWITIPALGPLSILIWLAALVIGGIWFGRLGSNADQLNRGDRTWSTAMLVTAWYIPFVNLVLPYFAVRELYRSTSPEVEWKETHVPLYVTVWWVLWALAGTLVLVAFFMTIATGAGAVFDVMNAGGDEAAAEEAATDAATSIETTVRVLSTASAVLVAAALPLYFKLSKEMAQRQDALMPTA